MRSSGVFAYNQIERIVWGEPAAAALKTEVERSRLKRVFLVVEPVLAQETDEVKKLGDALGARIAGIFERMPAHDPFVPVLEAAAAAREARADAIVSVGGGSQTDAAKVMQICLRHDVTDAETLAGFAVTVEADGTLGNLDYEGPAVRQIAIPTTLAGAELNPQCTSTDERIGAKRQFRHPLIVPRVVIYDEAITVLTPEWLWLSSGMRAVDHCVEALCSASANPISDATASEGLRLLTAGLRRCKADPRDLEARQRCLLGAWLSLIGRQGGVQMGASHAIGHVLGGTCDVPHGYTSCVMLPSVMRYNRLVNAERQKLVSALMGRAGAEAGDVIEAFIAELGLPGRLSDVGVGREQFRLVADHVMHDAAIHSNPRRIRSAAKVVEILEIAA